MMYIIYRASVASAASCYGLLFRSETWFDLQKWRIKRCREGITGVKAWWHIRWSPHRVWMKEDHASSSWWSSATYALWFSEMMWCRKTWSHGHQQDEQAHQCEERRNGGRGLSEFYGPYLWCVHIPVTEEATLGAYSKCLLEAKSMPRWSLKSRLQSLVFREECCSFHLLIGWELRVYPKGISILWMSWMSFLLSGLNFSPFEINQAIQSSYVIVAWPWSSSSLCIWNLLAPSYISGNFFGPLVPDILGTERCGNRYLLHLLHKKTTPRKWSYPIISYILEDPCMVYLPTFIIEINQM